MLVKRVLNPSKKAHIEGNTFHLIFLNGTDAVLYDHLWDEPIIYGNKTLVRTAISDDKKLPAYIDKSIKTVVLFVYKVMESGELKKVGELKGAPTELTVPNY